MSNQNQNRPRPNLRRPPTPVQRVPQNQEKKQPAPSRHAPVQSPPSGPPRSYEAKSKTPTPPTTTSGYQARSQRPSTTPTASYRPPTTPTRSSATPDPDEEELSYVFDEDLDYYPSEEEITVSITPKKKPQTTIKKPQTTLARPPQRKINPPPKKKPQPQPQARYAPAPQKGYTYNEEDEEEEEDDLFDEVVYGAQYGQYVDEVEEWVEPEPMFSIDWQALRPNVSLPAHPSMVLVLGTVGVIVLSLMLFGAWFLSGFWASLGDESAVQNSTSFVSPSASNSGGARAITAANGQLSPFFAPSVQYWAPQILQWSERHQLDPNMIATIMQIESCGDPQALSGAGAQGLFQVMPFHFEENEDGFHPDTNALRGMNYLADRLLQTNGDVGRAFAGYNGGHVAAAGNWDDWSAETQRYYTWGVGIYSDVLEGQATSDTLTQWFAAGGSNLCTQAEQRLGLR